MPLRRGPRQGETSQGEELGRVGWRGKRGGMAASARAMLSAGRRSHRPLLPCPERIFGHRTATSGCVLGGRVRLGWPGVGARGEEGHGEFRSRFVAPLARFVVGTVDAETPGANHSGHRGNSSAAPPVTRASQLPRSAASPTSLPPSLPASLPPSLPPARAVFWPGSSSVAMESTLAQSMVLTGRVREQLRKGEPEAAGTAVVAGGATPRASVQRGAGSCVRGVPRAWKA